MALWPYAERGPTRPDPGGVLLFRCILGKSSPKGGLRSCSVCGTLNQMFGPKGRARAKRGPVRFPDLIVQVNKLAAEVAATARTCSYLLEQLSEIRKQLTEVVNKDDRKKG